MKKFYISNGHNQEGPYTLDELENKLLDKNTLIWHDELTEWCAVHDVAEVSAIIKRKASPPPLPNTPPPIPPSDNNRYYTDYSSLINSTEAHNTSKKYKNKLYIVATIILSIAAIVWYVDYSSDQAALAAIEVEQYYQESLKVEEERLAEERRTYIRNNFTDFITTDVQYYYNPILGGIENLFVQLSNSSEYRLDKVIVAVEYIKDSGGIYKTEYIEFSKIKAKGTKNLRAPDSSRGTKVRCYISYASSERLNFLYDVNSSSGGSDPYRMR